jgi:hypothetical protein
LVARGDAAVLGIFAIGISRQIINIDGLALVGFAKVLIA